MCNSCQVRQLQLHLHHVVYLPLTNTKVISDFSPCRTRVLPLWNNVASNDQTILSSSCFNHGIWQRIPIFFGIAIIGGSYDSFLRSWYSSDAFSRLCSNQVPLVVHNDKALFVNYNTCRKRYGWIRQSHYRFIGRQECYHYGHPSNFVPLFQEFLSSLFHRSGIRSSVAVRCHFIDLLTSRNVFSSFIEKYLMNLEKMKNFSRETFITMSYMYVKIDHDKPH